MILVALIEDNRLVRDGIAGLLSQVSDLKVVVAAGSGATPMLRRTRPQVVLLDLSLRNGDSLRIARNILRAFPDSKVIVMDLLPVDEDLEEFVDAGVSGYVMKDASLDDLVSTIRRVAEGARVLPAPATGTLFSRIARAAVVSRRSQALQAVRMTPRERQVVHLIAEGLGNREIADRLGIATYTVRSHVRNVMEKLMLHTRLQIAAYAHRDRTS